MALDDLTATIEKLQDRIRTHRPYLSGNETATRQVLIDPLLLALGWDVSDPAQVALEYSAGGGRADYALMPNDQPVAVIEAKNLDTSLEERETMQVLNYANSRGIPYMVVTNGDDWRMYDVVFARDVFARQPIEERILMQFSITQTPAHESALQALRMWRSNLASSGNPMPAREPVLQSDEKEPPPADEQEGETPPQPITESEWILLTDLSGINKTSPKPKCIKLPDGQTESFRVSAVGVLRETAKWLANSGKLTPKNARIEHPKYQNRCVSSDTEQTLQKPEKICDGVYFDKNWGAQDTIEGTIALLKHCGEDPSKIHVKLNR